VLVIPEYLFSARHRNGSSQGLADRGNHSNPVRVEKQIVVIRSTTMLSGRRENRRHAPGAQRLQNWFKTGWLAAA